jgi:hypothetical protein
MEGARDEHPCKSADLGPFLNGGETDAIKNLLVELC